VAKLHPDGQGRLILVPGSGVTGHVHATAADAQAKLKRFSPGWYDDVGDGPVSAQIRRKNPQDSFDDRRVVSAWVVIAPPAYGGPVRESITLYDKVLELYRMRIAGLPATGRFAPHAFSFRADVHPLLHRASLASWTTNNAFLFHSPGMVADFADAARLVRLGTNDMSQATVSERKRIHKRVELPPANATAGMNSMPPAGLGMRTSVQVLAFQTWANDPTHFAFDWQWPAPPIDEPGEMTCCHLSSASGGQFFPGVEVSWPTARATTWALDPAPGLKHATWDDAFRVVPTTPPGTLTSNLGVPWQVDLLGDCMLSSIDPLLPHGVRPIWPAARPLEVRDQSGVMKLWGLEPVFGYVKPLDAINRWQEFGFLRKVVSSGQVRYLDGERIAPYP
jgi:hypothetical protein